MTAESATQSTILRWPSRWPKPIITLDCRDGDSRIDVSEIELLQVASCLVPRLGMVARVPALIAVNQAPHVVTWVEILGREFIRFALLSEIREKPPGSPVWIGGQRNHASRVMEGYIGAARYEVRS